MRDLAVEAPAVEAPAQQKFGMFLGVYTPSILTILGVIMYQRFGWVVGNAGLGGAIAVVLLAHVISVTTGLSVASIATNHTVKTGGNYYIISRSLGLSIGGAIGLALYVALALGVSLYLIGFAEAFIAATGLSPFDDEINNLRLIGSIACICMALLTLYSTSFALKSQLFVLGAIVLSLFSIAFGSGVPAVVGETAVALGPPEGAPAFAAVFAVFFPAVTGFTAGVGMSGDLRDPKRAIPVGTMAAIITGLVIYLALPFLVAESATVQQLQTDNNILLRTSFEPRLVTAGVFAATLSSALGSILGAPRTLQALAFDGIVPKLFGRGRDEPRVALVVTIIIAEAGILVGELELVGAVISMFFLTCYGFLCLACGLERWASPDFRPQFKVPIWVSLLGAVACFMVMFQINALAMFGAIMIMGLIYAVLKRRQLVLQSGDTWGGVWSAVVRAGLIRLRRSATTVAATRNWRPNMIVLSREQRRGDMIDFGRSIVGDRGILTHFDLLIGGPLKARVDKSLEEQYPGLFARVQGCDDVYAAIPNIVTNFGLAGMESNVVLLGWPRDASLHVRYAAMTARLLELDISVCMLRLDAARGFGKRERIDLWWDGEAPTGPLMLTLAHMLLASPSWKNARLRVLVNGRRGADEAGAKRRLEAMIEDARVSAEAVLLAPLSEEGSLADRIRQESQHADLVMIHALEATDEQDFVARNDAVIAPLGTALLVRPAKIFSEAPVIFEAEESTPDVTGAFDILDVSAPSIPELDPVVRRMLESLTEATERFGLNVQQPSLIEERQQIDAVVAEVKQITQLERRLNRRGGRREAARGLVEWAKGRFITSTLEGVRRLRDTTGKNGPWERRVKEAVVRLRADVVATVEATPEWASVATERVHYESHSEDRFGVRMSKLRVRLGMKLFNRRPPPRRVPARQVAMHHLGRPFIVHLEASLRQIGVRRFDSIRRVRRLAYDVERFFSNLLAELDQSVESKLDTDAYQELLARELISLMDVAEGVRERFDAANEASFKSTRALVARTAQKVVTDLERPDVLEVASGWSPAKEERAVRRVVQALDESPALWKQQHDAILSALELDLMVAALKIDARRAMHQLFVRVRREIEQGPIKAIVSAETIMRRAIELREEAERIDSEPPTEGEEKAPDETSLHDDFLAAADELRGTWEKRYRPEPRELFDHLLASLARAAEKLPESVTTTTERALDAAAEGQPERNTVSFPARRYAQAFVEKLLGEPVREVLAELPERVRDAQSALVDAVRLVAFELEQAATTQDDDPDAAGPLELGGVLEDRLGRLDAAKRDIEGYVDTLREVLLVATVRALEAARDAVVGGGGQSTGPAPSRVSLPQRRLVKRAVRAVGAARGRVGRTVDELAERRNRTLTRTGGTLSDELLLLREQLAPRIDVQASLPLIYRRLFGRAALETSDLHGGREEELSRITQMIDRWRGAAAGPIAIVGAPRSGRTSLANIVGRELLPDQAVVRVNAPPGGTGSPEDVNKAVVEAVGAREGQGAEGALRAMPPGAVMVIDDLGRWIERAPGGLAALSLWLKLFRRLGDRHLFLLTATDVAWRYVDELVGVRGRFLGTVELGALRRRALLDALQLRQRTSDFELAFERERGAFSRLRLSNERQHLARLYDRSGGNVGAAIDLWRRSIVGVGERRVTLDVAPPPDVSVLTRLPLMWCAALANVALHHAVTAQRMARIGRMSREEATGLLGDLERAGLLVSDKSGAYALDTAMQPLILDALKRRGVIA